MIILILFPFQWNLIHKVFQKIYILVLELLNLHLTFLRYGLFHHLAYLFFFLFYLFLVLLMILVFYLSQYAFKPFIWSLNFSIIKHFFKGVKGKDIFAIFEKLTVYFDLVPKSLYLFVSDSAELYSIIST